MAARGARAADGRLSSSNQGNNLSCLRRRNDLRTALLIAVGAFAFGLGSNALSIAQNSSNFEKRNFNHLIPMGSSCSIASSLVASASFIQRWTGCTQVNTMIQTI